MSTATKPNAGGQFSQSLDAFKKHQFWILLGIVVITAVVVWYLATSDLQAAYTADTRKIDGEFGNLAGMVSQPLRNQEMINEVESEQKKIHQQSLEAWNVLFKRQQPLFAWPDDSPGVKSIETIPLGQEIPLNARADFADIFYRADEKLKLPKKWYELFLRVRPNFPVDAKPSPEYVDIVDWDISARQAIASRYIAAGAPTTVRVRTTMEDYWVYQNLLDLVSAMNQDATDRGQAKIKRIRALEIAQWAIKAAHENVGIEHKDINPTKTGGRPLTPPLLQGQTHPKDDAILSNRYLDGDNRPIKSGSPEPFAEFRQMFVLMRFVMAQEAITDLLARCANAPFPIVARQVLVKYRDTDTLLRGDDKFDPQAFNDNTAITPNDCLVEIRGLIFLYNPADTDDLPEDKRKLGTGAAAKPAHRKIGIPPMERVQ